MIRSKVIWITSYGSERNANESDSAGQGSDEVGNGGDRNDGVGNANGEKQLKGDDHVDLADESPSELRGLHLVRVQLLVPILTSACLQVTTLHEF